MLITVICIYSRLKAILCLSSMIEVGCLCVTPNSGALTTHAATTHKLSETVCSKMVYLQIHSGFLERLQVIYRLVKTKNLYMAPLNIKYVS